MEQKDFARLVFSFASFLLILSRADLDEVEEKDSINIS